MFDHSAVAAVGFGEAIDAKRWEDAIWFAKKELDAAEGKVQILIKQRDGSLKPEPFE